MRKLDFAWQIYSTLRGLPDVTRQRHMMAYEVRDAVTVYVRASHSRITVRRTMARQVQIECDLWQAFGWEWVVDRDEAGIYIVLKRRPVVGALSFAALTVTVPPDAYLAFNLTPGSVLLEDFDGRLSVAPVSDAESSGVRPAGPG